MGAGSKSPTRFRALWRAQAGPQEDLLSCPADIILLGGARGGGKTAGCLVGDWLLHMHKLGRHANGIVLRRHMSHAENTQEEMRTGFYEQLGAKGGRPPSNVFRFPSGATLRFGFLATEQDAAQYSGHNYTWCLIEEVNQIADWSAVFRMLAALRSSHQVPERRFLMTCNPEGPGLGWLKDRFITPAPRGLTVFQEQFEADVLGEDNELVGKPLTSIFIPANIKDNQQLLGSDPHYFARLAGSTGGTDSPLYQAWVKGDWDALSGQFFDRYADWRDAGGVLHRFAVPPDWPRFVSGDWGSAVPFCFHWWAVVPDNYRTHRGTLLPKGAVVLYREYYGVATDSHGRAKPNKGIKLDATSVGRQLARLAIYDPPRKYAVLDPACFRSESGPSVAEQLETGEDAERKALGARPLSTFDKADNTRTPRTGAAGGWSECRARMSGVTVSGMQRPMVYVFDSCYNLLRTMIAMVHDPKNPEDMLKDSHVEDHAVDCFRYGIMSRPPLATEQPAGPRYGDRSYGAWFSAAEHPTARDPDRGVTQAGY